MKSKIATLIILLLALTSCVTTGSIKESSFVSETNIEHNLGNWVIDFKYENITTEVKTNENGEVEKVVKNYGQSDINLIFIDELYHRLRNINNVNVFRTSDELTEASGKIIIHPVIIPGPGYYNYVVEITILNDENELIARSLVQKYDYAAEGITNITQECVDYILGTI